MEEVEKIKEYLKDLILVMANRAEKEVDALMPGYTHVQVGQSAAILRSNAENLLICSELNPFDGRTCFSPTLTPSTPISTVSPNLFPGSPSFPSAVQHLRETLTRSTESSSENNSGSTRWVKTRCTLFRIETSSSSFCSGRA